MTAGMGAAAYRAAREHRFRKWIRDLDAEDWSNIGANAGALVIALFVFGVPIYAIIQGTNVLSALFG